MCYLWAYKYDGRYWGNIGIHVDEAAVSTIWLTPDDARTVVVFVVKPPESWDHHAMYNQDNHHILELLKPSDFANATIAHKQNNRVVIFDSVLFRKTDLFSFKPGYENRRINLTVYLPRYRKEVKRRMSSSVHSFLSNTIRIRAKIALEQDVEVNMNFVIHRLDEWTMWILGDAIFFLKIDNRFNVITALGLYIG